MYQTKHIRSVDALFHRNKRDLFKCLARRVGRQEASDLLQDTFVRVLQNDTAGAIADEDAYLRTTALNLARDFSRRTKTVAKYIMPVDVPLDIAEAGLDPLQTCEGAEKVRQLYAAIDNLPPRCREVFVLRRFRDLSSDEIARKLRISRNMVEKHLRLALERCRAALD